MKHIPVRLGPLALLLTVIAMCMAVLAVLSFSNSGADMRLSERYGQAVRARYLLEKDGQEFLQQMNSEAAAEGTARKTFERDGYILAVELEPEDGHFEITKWEINKIWEQDASIGNLWQGN